MRFAAPPEAVAVDHSDELPPWEEEPASAASDCAAYAEPESGGDDAEVDGSEPFAVEEAA